MLGFRGRSIELRDLQLIIERQNDHLHNVLCVTGETGIGKTSIAYHIFQLYSSHPAFETAHAISAYMMPWKDLVPEIARTLLDKLPPRATVSELQHEILACIRDRKILLLLDFVDKAGNQINEFIRDWAAASNSFLILTMRSYSPDKSLNSNCEVYELGGITDGWLVKDLLGKQMVRRIEQNQIWKDLKALNNNPQKLLYLSWRSPETKDDIIRCVRDLARGATEFDAVDSILGRIRQDLPLEHFLALGRIRIPEIEEGFLAFLWDRLGRGGAEQYIQTLQQLQDVKLLEPVDRGKLRVNAHVHVQLQRACEVILGPERRNHIEYYIGIYFRRQFSKNRDAEFRIRDLGSYVYHMIRSGNLKSAYAYVFGSDVLETARRRGLSLELQSILRELDVYLQKRLAPAEKIPDDERGWLTEMAAHIKLELGRVCKDLSKHTESLTYLDKTAHLLDSSATPAVKAMVMHRLRADVEHYRGIAYSQTGSTHKCLKAYLESVSYATDHDCFGTREALSLGYLAYELKFHDIEEAQRIGQKAVDIGINLGDHNVIAKNLCNLGQIQSFVGKVEDSVESFRRAEKHCSEDSGDVRELGRILINSAVTFIATNHWEEAEDRLRRGADLIGESGDRRRKSMADAYLGIILYRKGRKSEGQHLVLEALHRHKGIGAVREVIYEALTLTWMIFDGSMPEPVDILNCEEIPKEVQAIMKDIINRKLGIFVNFWGNHYMPTLLNSSLKENWW